MTDNYPTLDHFPLFSRPMSVTDILQTARDAMETLLNHTEEGQQDMGEAEIIEYLVTLTDGSTHRVKASSVEKSSHFLWFATNRGTVAGFQAPMVLCFVEYQPPEVPSVTATMLPPEKADIRW